MFDIIAYMYNFARTSKRSKNYRRSYLNLARKLSKFAEQHRLEITTETVNERVLEEFVDYMRREGLMKSTIFCLVTRVKTILRRMQAEDIQVNRSCFDFSVESEQGNAIYLTSDEVRQIAALQIKKREVAIIRDVFVVGCLTGMRYSDYVALTSSNIVGNTIVRRTKKTGATVVIPIHPLVREILARYGGEFPRYRRSQANFNKVIKNICKRAGVKGYVLVERTVGMRVQRKRIKRYTLVGSHTARRSFATNLYLAGVSAGRIMLLTGHKTEDAFFRYIRINKEENAKVLSEHAFFR
ncbi:tyrosine-type recombinase/integrase [Tannerella forsythia]|uniref:site-specific integrase n=1 Tax=Tannerella forsythia TaxID=28112 RepID=UPI0028EC01F3|nr:tyrosine-type recombinase/integrase [Tannerella forsythia]